MGLKGILAINGQPGLFRVLVQTKNGFIVESLVDKKRIPVTAAQRVNMLEDISIYTQTDDLPLKAVMNKILEFSHNNSLPDPKADPKILKSFFQSIVPDFDQERVYTSDIKKIINWFNLTRELLAVNDDEAEETENAPDEKESPGDTNSDTE